MVASDVGGLSTTVANGRSGLLVTGHSAWDWSRVLGQVLGDDIARARLAAGARTHAEQFSWDRTTRELLAVYREAVVDFARTAAVAS